MSEFDEFSFLPAQAADAGIGGPLPSVRRVSLTLDDGRTLSGLRYGDAPPEVTFLHGAGLNAHTWDTTVLALGRPALALDFAGHGDSSWRGDAVYTPRVLAPDVATALDAWTERPQVLVGQSLGGLTAAPVALLRPDAVRAIVVVDISPGIDPSAGPAQLRAFFAGPTDWATRDELVDRAVRFGLGGGKRDKVARGVALNSRERADGRIEWKHHFAHLAAAAANAPAQPASAEDSAGPGDPLRDVLSQTAWDDLAAVTVPVWLVRATEGFVTEGEAEEFVRRVPGTTVTALDGPHNLQEDSAVTLADVIRGVLGNG